MRFASKIIALIGIASLLLVGCQQDAQLVTEAVKNNFDTTSVESKSTVTFDLNLPEAEDHPIFDLLSSGIVMDAKQKNLQEAAVSISANNPETIKGTELWPFDEDPAIDLIVRGNDLLITSPVDKPALLLPVEESGDIPPEKMNELALEFVENFIENYDYTFENVVEKGTETVSLPNGNDVSAKHIQINMDLEEAIDVTIYTLESLAESDELKELFALFMVNEEMEEMPDLSELMQEGFLELAAMLKDVKNEHLDESGVEANIVFDYWINDDTEIVQEDAMISVHLPQQLTGETEDITIDLDMTSQYWNRDGDVELDVPADIDTISVEQISENPDLLNEFTEGSPLYAFAELMLPVPDFDDVSEDFWAYEEIQMLKMLGIIEGYEDNTFEPRQSITRAEFTKMVVASFGIPAEGELPFDDADEIDDWAKPFVATAVDMDLITGYDDGTFRPNELISRDEMVTVFVRALDISTDVDADLSFKDLDQIDDWALPYVKAAVANDLVEGRPGNRFDPKGEAERAEVAALLYRAIFQLDF